MLKITLNESVTDSTMLRLGEVCLKVSIPDTSDAANRKIVINPVGGSVNLRIVGEGYFTNAQGTSDDGQTKTISSNTTIYLSSGTYMLFVGDKKNIMSIGSETGIGFFSFVDGSFKMYQNLTGITFFRFKGDGFDFDINENLDLSVMTDVFLSGENGASVSSIGSIEGFRGSDVIKNIDLRYTKCDGDLSALSSSTDLRALRISGSNIKGSISSLNNCTKMTSLQVVSLGDVTGAIEDLLDAFVLGGRDSGQIIVNAYQSGITYNGQAFPYAQITFKFSSSYERGWDV